MSAHSKADPRPAPVVEPSAPEKLRMEAYYYGFTPTGVVEVDRVLSAVACAGKSYHNTEDWNEVGRDGKSVVDAIQDAANALAAALRSEPQSPSALTVNDEDVEQALEAVRYMKIFDGNGMRLIIRRVLEDYANRHSGNPFGLTEAELDAAREEMRADVPALRSEPRPQEPGTGPRGFLLRLCQRFDALLSLDHREARQTSEQYDDAFHDTVHALKDLRRFADQIAPTWRAASEPRPAPTSEELREKLEDFMAAAREVEATLHHPAWRAEETSTSVKLVLRQKLERLATVRAEVERLFARSQGYTREDVLRIATAAAVMHHGYPPEGWSAADAALMAIEAERSPKEER